MDNKELKDKIIKLLNEEYVEDKLGETAPNISADAVESIADDIVNLLPIHDVRRSILRELKREKKNHLKDKNTPHIESRKYAIAHGNLTATLKAIEIVKQYCA